MKQLQEKDPDCDDQIEFIQNSIKFIGLFCIKNKIKIDSYVDHKTGITYDWMKHVKNNEISIYSLMEFKELFEKVMGVPEDERELFLGDLSKRFYAFKDRYIKSQTAKYLVKEGMTRIKEIVESKLQVDNV
jgi:hypothetical protein